MYLIQIDHLVYTRRDGSPWTLVQAIRELHGCAHARVLRMNGTPAITNAGSDYAVTHAPTGRIVRRRAVYRSTNR